MLLSFHAKNYRSFRDSLDFSMTPAAKQKGLDYSILSEKIGTRDCKALSSAVIYGPNASGKTNIIGAMDTMRSIVLRGNIENSESVSTPNAASCKLELIPFSQNEEPSPVEFSVRFTDSGKLFEYSFSMNIGGFMDKDYKRKLVFEQLKVNDKEIYTRTDSLEFGSLTGIRQQLNNPASGNISALHEIAENSLNPTELFLTNGFKTIFSKNLVSTITGWFSDKFMIVYRADSVQLMHRFADPKEKTVYIEKTLNEAAEAFGISSNALGFMNSKDENESELYSIFDRKDGGMAIPAELFESYGTIRFVNEFPLVIRALLTGAVLVVDEFDASIHPMALMNIINIFHNDDINKNHAQLIFNTHNPIFLNSNLYRRDEIKFVERDEKTHASIHYALSDFKTYGKSGVRKGEDYMRNYFVSQYGAIKDVDFSGILEKLIDGKSAGGDDNG